MARKRVSSIETKTVRQFSTSFDLLVLGHDGLRDRSSSTTDCISRRHGTKVQALGGHWTPRGTIVSPAFEYRPVLHSTFQLVLFCAFFPSYYGTLIITILGWEIMAKSGVFLAHYILYFYYDVFFCGASCRQGGGPGDVRIWTARQKTKLN